MFKHSIQVAPSILSGDFGSLAEESRRIEQAGADAIHIDIMDGHFVPNLTLGPKAVTAIRKATSLFLDVHLMIYNPFDYIEAFIQSGADRITFHFEATEDVEDALKFIRRCGKEAGLAFCPETSISFLPSFLESVDLILLMTVHPGFGGQKFKEEVVDKIVAANKIMELASLKKRPWIQVDGGIDLHTAKKAVDAGANYLVAGTYLFSLPDMKKGIIELKHCAQGG